MGLWKRFKKWASNAWKKVKSVAKTAVKIIISFVIATFFVGLFILISLGFWFNKGFTWSGLFSTLLMLICIPVVLAGIVPFSIIFSIMDHKFELVEWGVYCGPGHSNDDKENRPAPIDQIDALCQQHDDCYHDHGDGNCDCDKQLVAGLTKAISNEENPAAKAAALLILEYFNLQIAANQCLLDFVSILASKV